ncbi:hypothetical protein CIB48_g10209 [Xylaria polymorpha]|nr:hypothetical protein CIB48_g10209 [Xylaria polymorpha]
MIDAPMADEWTPEFKKFLLEKPIKIPFDKTKELQRNVERFLERARKARHDENSYPAVEELREEIYKWTANMCLATVTNQEFKNDIANSHRNEAVFRRIVMMLIVNRFHLKPTFGVNCDGDWSLPGSHPLPSTGGLGDMIADPNPDLAIFFSFDALVGKGLRDQKIPTELESCMNPDNHQGPCFPFIFIGGKKAFSNINIALLENIHSSSQVPFNIYLWMAKAGHQATFFKDVRLFSFAISAQKVIARVRRAVPRPNF